MVINRNTKQRVPPLQEAVSRIRRQRLQLSSQRGAFTPQLLYGVLRNLLVKTAGLTGGPFLDAACKAFASEFDSQFVFITRAIDAPPTTVRMLAACRDGASVRGWEFRLSGTPCEAIYQSPTRDVAKAGIHVGCTLIARDVRRLFEPTRETRFESFIGIPLCSATGAMIGHVALFFNRRLDDLVEQGRLVELVRLYSLKVEAELNRILIDESRQLALDELRLVNERLAQETVTDGLTGLYKRRHFNDRIRRVFALRLRQGQPFGLLLLDLDHFKAVNDRHGHAAGDAVLCGVAQILTAHTRRDIEEVFRVGGEEFAIICCGVVTAGDLAGAGDRLVRAIRNATILHEGGRLPVTVSIGGAFPAAEDADWGGCYRRADAHLYVAKSEGRDRAVVRLEGVPVDPVGLYGAIAPASDR